jgi:hypothetical protein
MKTLVLVNTLTSINSFVYASHIDFFMKAQKQVPDNKFFFFYPHRLSIDKARNAAAQHALSLDCDYLMFIDDDVMVPPDTFKKLVDAQKDIIAGLVMIRGLPFNVMAFKGDRDENGVLKRNILGNLMLGYFNDLPKNEDGTLVELAKCEAVGFSCCLINMDVIRAIEPPYFITGPSYTEDVFFCLKAMDSLTPTPEIYLHTGVRCGHLMPQEPIEWDMKPVFTDFYNGIIAKEKEANPRPEQPQFPGRNLEYLQLCLKEL